MITAEEETIAAIATAMGQGSIAIVRISGKDAVKTFEKVFVSAAHRPPYQSHRLMFGHIVEDGKNVDECMGVVMYAPNSYTREDVCEIHTHGGYAAAASVMRVLLKEGVRPAEAGEFTRRAFLNGRIDLSQAEAVMGIISANGQAALRNQERQLQGGALQFIGQAQKKVIQLLSGLEAHIDYPDEIGEEEALTGLTDGLRQLIGELKASVREREARIIREGLHVTLCGRPNSGKSTLFNRLLGEEKAIVTEIPGTTRDVLEGTFMLDGVAVHLSDTAGIRDSSDAVEQIGVRRAEKAIAEADALLMMIDASEPLAQERKITEIRADIPRAVLFNKQDLSCRIEEETVRTLYPDAAFIRISAKTGEGTQEILNFLRPLTMLPQDDFLTNERHLRCVSAAVEKLQSALESLQSGALLDLAAIDLHDALYELGRVTGESVDEKLLDEVFEHFCVGK